MPHPSSRPTRLQLALLEARDVPSRTLFVDDDRVQIPSAAFTSIQAAVDAARRGDDIVVAPGVYREQVTFDADKDGITLKSRNPRQAVIEAPAVLGGSQAIVSIEGADRVTVRGFTITGPAQQADGLLYGVLVFDGGSAEIENNLITKIRNNPLNGNQLGHGILVFGDGRRTTAEIEGNTITDYQKGGVLVFGPDADAEVSDNVIRGVGPTGVIAQNGVEVSTGASAEIEDNSISANVYTGTETFAAGVLLTAADRVTVSDNRLFANTVGVAAFFTDGVTISDNRVFGNFADGIQLAGVDRGRVTDNRVTENGGDGIVLDDTTRVRVSDNRVTENGGDGLVLTNGSADNRVSDNFLRWNAGFDAFDDTTGCGTGGTANHWFGNRIGTKNRPGLR